MKNTFYKAMLVMSAVSFLISLCAIIMCIRIFNTPSNTDTVCKTDIPLSLPGANAPADKVLFLCNDYGNVGFNAHDTQEKKAADCGTSPSEEKAETASKDISAELIVFFDEESEKLTVADSDFNELFSYSLSATHLTGNDIEALRYGLTIEKNELGILLEDLLY